MTDGDGLAGATTIYVWRAKGSTTRFNDLKIQRMTPTAVNIVSEKIASNDEKVKKIVVNGKLVISKNGKQYTAAGALVK